MRLFRLKSISRNHFTPCRVFGCVWKIWSNGKSFLLTVKSPTSAIKSITLSFYLQMISRTYKQREREREREREERAQGFETHLPSAPPHAPTRERCSSTPHADADSRSPTLRRAVPPYLIHSTSPPPTLSSTCTRSTKAKLSLMPTKPISPSTSLIRHSHIASETLLSNPPSTIPNPHPFKPISLFFSSLTQPHLRDHAAEIIVHDPPMTNLSLSRSTYLFPPIFDHSLCLPLLVWSNCLSLGNDFVLIFVFLSLYIEIFNYKICLDAKKVAEKKWENSIFIMQTNTWKYFLKQFLYYSQTLKNIFLSQKYFSFSKIFSPKKIILYSTKRILNGKCLYFSVSFSYQLPASVISQTQNSFIFNKCSLPLSNGLASILSPCWPRLR